MRADLMNVVYESVSSNNFNILIPENLVIYVCSIRFSNDGKAVYSHTQSNQKHSSKKMGRNRYI
uniref:Uncharacterized protein n=1 Tax=Arion vulgaris TaxID=1028688 RepID=A0A0B6ZHR3_9EUPU